MGEVEVDFDNLLITIHSHIITYGNSSSEEITERIRNEIEYMWNEPAANLQFRNKYFNIRFSISASINKNLQELEVLENTDPKNNYIRIEDFVHGNISFVDGIGSNTGYFLLENLYEGSTTAAHEYGHTIGLNHPTFLDIRGEGIPGIMYPRGTLVDPTFQYDMKMPAGSKGGTLHPMYRKVRQEDINLLKINKLSFVNGRAIIGDFTNIYHWAHPKQEI